MNSWTEYVPERSARRHGQPTAVVGSNGDLRITPDVVAMMGDPTHVTLHFDKTGRRVALRAVKPGPRHAFPLKQYRGNAMYNISSYGFFKWAGEAIGTRRQFSVEPLDSTSVVIDLGDGGDEGEFEEFLLKGALLVHAQPNASVSRNGHITLNDAATSIFGRPEFVVMLFDQSTRRIGLRRATTEANARPLRKAGAQGTWVLAAEGFLKRFGIPHDEGRSYEPSLEDDILVIDLNQPKAARRHRVGV